MVGRTRPVVVWCIVGVCCLSFRVDRDVLYYRSTIPGMPCDSSMVPQWDSEGKGVHVSTGVRVCVCLCVFVWLWKGRRRYRCCCSVCAA